MASGSSGMAWREGYTSMHRVYPRIAGGRDRICYARLCPTAAFTEITFRVSLVIAHATPLPEIKGRGGHAGQQQDDLPTSHESAGAHVDL